MPKPADRKLCGDGQEASTAADRSAENKVGRKANNKEHPAADQHDPQLGVHPLHPPGKLAISTGQHCDVGVPELKNRYIHQ